MDSEEINYILFEYFDLLMDTQELWLDYVWINVPQRSVSLQSSDGNIEKIRFKWDEEGAEGFQEVIATICETVPEDQRCFVSK
jgi:hypothetical protein|tara:strand:+ start:238 stop:486 length:249 start_codon:yes stop_codon:yes gene_type:complete